MRRLISYTRLITLHVDRRTQRPVSLSLSPLSDALILINDNNDY